jgi:hypothetical protein
VGSERQAGVVCTPPPRAQPATLEQRADDVTAVADNVDELRLRKRTLRRLGHKRRLWGLLDRPHSAGEREAPGQPKRATDPYRGIGGLGLFELGDSRLESRDFPEVDETRARSDRLRKERRSRARASEHEDQPLVERRDGSA